MATHYQKYDIASHLFSTPDVQIHYSVTFYSIWIIQTGKWARTIRGAIDMFELSNDIALLSFKYDTEQSKIKTLCWRKAHL